MPAVSVLIKPASSACNMQCKYCFYKDETENREQAFCGMLSEEVAEKIIIRAVEFAEGSCTFMFQGGEPTLAGLPFYENFLKLEEKHKKEGLRFYHCIQTNGYALTDAWAKFFKEHNFLVGVSLDGPAEIHNLNRPDTMGKGSFNKVMSGIHLLEKYEVDFNILAVVTGKSARSANKIYSFFKKNNFRYLQFIPCLEPLAEERGLADFHLSPESYEQFLTSIFKLWYADLKKGEYVSIRHIDNMFSILGGKQPEICSMRGCCSIQFVVEGDGSVYPCDFYVLDEWKLGTVQEHTFQEMLYSDKAKEFIKSSQNVPEDCKNCPYGFLCRNGCRRDRNVNENGSIGKNYYCKAYKNYYSKNARDINDALKMLTR